VFVGEEDAKVRKELEAIDALDVLAHRIVAERAAGGERQLHGPEVKSLLGRRDRPRSDRLHRHHQRQRAQPPGRPSRLPHTPLL
jgi:hypothetical protein